MPSVGKLTCNVEDMDLLYLLFQKNRSKASKDCISKDDLAQVFKSLLRSKKLDQSFAREQMAVVRDGNDALTFMEFVTLLTCAKVPSRLNVIKGNYDGIAQDKDLRITMSGLTDACLFASESYGLDSRKLIFHLKKVKMKKDKLGFGEFWRFLNGPGLRDYASLIRAGPASKGPVSDGPGKAAVQTVVKEAKKVGGNGPAAGQGNSVGRGAKRTNARVRKLAQTEGQIKLEAQKGPAVRPRAQQRQKRKDRPNLRRTVEPRANDGNVGKLSKGNADVKAQQTHEQEEVVDSEEQTNERQPGVNEKEQHRNVLNDAEVGKEQNTHVTQEEEPRKKSATQIFAEARQQSMNSKRSRIELLRKKRRESAAEMTLKVSNNLTPVDELASDSGESCDDGTDMSGLAGVYTGIEPLSDFPTSGDVGSTMTLAHKRKWAAEELSRGSPEDLRSRLDSMASMQSIASLFSIVDEDTAVTTDPGHPGDRPFVPGVPLWLGLHRNPSLKNVVLQSFDDMQDLVSCIHEESVCPGVSLEETEDSSEPLNNPEILAAEIVADILEAAFEEARRQMNGFARDF